MHKRHQLNIPHAMMSSVCDKSIVLLTMHRRGIVLASANCSGKLYVVLKPGVKPINTISFGRVLHVLARLKYGEGNIRCVSIYPAFPYP